MREWRVGVEGSEGEMGERERGRGELGKRGVRRGELET